MNCKGLFSALLKACEYFRMSRERQFDLVLGDKTLKYHSILIKLITHFMIIFLFETGQLFYLFE